MGVPSWTRELALFSLAIDSELRSCELAKLRVHDVPHRQSYRCAEAKHNESLRSRCSLHRAPRWVHGTVCRCARRPPRCANSARFCMARRRYTLCSSIGSRLCHSVACSYARARLRTVPSLPGAPVICMPIGRPDCVNPQGTEIVGAPNISKGRVL